MTGRVLDIETQAPVLAYVYRNGVALAMTGEDGRFDTGPMPVPARVTFEAVGYEPQPTDVYTDDEQGNVYMVPRVPTLDPVIVTPGDRPVAVSVPGWAWLALGALALWARGRRR